MVGIWNAAAVERAAEAVLRPVPCCEVAWRSGDDRGANGRARGSSHLERREKKLADAVQQTGAFANSVVRSVALHVQYVGRWYCKSEPAASLYCERGRCWLLPVLL
jgi:hypothetical protein